MDNCSFHGQLLSVMEVLAKAAEAEINRRVDDSCAVLRLEVRQSRQDIELLKKKCEVMEAELRRSRVRARRKAADRFSPLVRVVLNRGRRNSDWDRQTEPEGQSQAQQGADESNESVLIKEECPEEDAWKNDSEDKPSEQVTCFDASQPVQTDRLAERRPSAETACDPKPAPSPTHGYSAFPEQQLDGIQNEAELSVKHERQEELDENAAPLESAHGFGTEEGDGQMWSSSLCRDSVDPGFSYTGEQFEPVPSGFTSQSGLILGDMAPQIHLEGKSYSAGVSSVRVKKRGRAFGCRRTQNDGQNTLSQMNATDQCLITQQAQHQNTHSSPLMANARVDLATPTTAAASFCRYSRSGFGLARRVRTPWRPSVGEKRFSCTYCDKNFMRFSQLKEHLRSHTGEKPFSCLLCGRSFTKQCNLIRHAVVHSGEKPHECSLCGKCFTQRSSLKSHQKTAH